MFSGEYFKQFDMAKMTEDGGGGRGSENPEFYMTAFLNAPQLRFTIRDIIFKKWYIKTAYGDKLHNFSTLPMFVTHLILYAVFDQLCGFMPNDF